MLAFFRSRAYKLLLTVMDLFSTSNLTDIIEKTIAHRAHTLPPDQALFFLFHVDNHLYNLEGTKAVAYGGGLHTKHRHTRYHDFFVARVRPGERVLDVGCGNGAVAYDLAKKARAEVVGIDLSAENIAQAQSRYHHRKLQFMVGDVLKDLPDKHFDVLILSNVLEHFEARSAFLRRVREKINPSRVLIRVPLYERDWRVPLKRELGMEWRLDSTHKTEYTQESFGEEIKAAGLKITHQEVRWGEIWAEAVPHV